MSADYMDAIACYNESAEAKGHDEIPTLDQVDEVRKEAKENV